MGEAVMVKFSGPFSWSGLDGAPCIFDTPLARHRGVYLWTVPQGDSELVYYVGETGRDFATRMLEHFREHCSGGYHLYSPEAFGRGVKISLWPGRYNPEVRPSVADFMRRVPELWPAILELATLYRFFLAPLDCERRLRERVEAAIAHHLRTQPGVVGGFQDQGIRYSPRRDDEPPVVASLRCLRALLGLPGELLV